MSPNRKKWCLSPRPGRGLGCRRDRGPDVSRPHYGKRRAVRSVRAVAAASLLAGPGPGLLATLLSIPLGARGFLVSPGTPIRGADPVGPVRGGRAPHRVLVGGGGAGPARRPDVRGPSARAHRAGARPVLSGHLDGRFTDVNESACRMLGYEREELIGKTIADFLPPEDCRACSPTAPSCWCPGR